MPKHSNTPILDNPDLLKDIDQNNALQSIEELGSQISQIWDLADKMIFDFKPQDITTVVVAGMGGSTLGTDVIKSLFNEELKVPVIIAPGYTVPAFVNEKTLVIVSSYSGNTEETMSATLDAYNKGAHLIGMTTGGKIASFFAEKKLPLLMYEPLYNPSKIAHMGLGYSIFGQMMLFAKAGLISLQHDSYQNILDAIAEVHLQASVTVNQEKNLAKILAFNLINKIPIITVAEHLEGAAHVFANQLNEAAKTYAEYRVIPELNHHLMEGFKFPENSDSLLMFATYHSNLYHKQNQLRMTLTQEVLEKNNLDFVSHSLSKKTKIGQVFELITLGAYTAFYLAMLNNQNPVLLPNVEWFKNELGKRSQQ